MDIFIKCGESAMGKTLVKTATDYLMLVVSIYFIKILSLVYTQEGDVN